MRTGLFLDPALADHQPGPHHPESPDRIAAIQEALDRAGLPDRCLPIAPRQAADEEILRAHSEGYLRTVQREIDGRSSGVLSTGDTHFGPRTLEVARSAAGAALEAVDAVAGGRCENAFCVVRPPGHHADRDRGMGFCVFNHVALAARHAQERHGIERIAIVDWDVHHGNGTQDIFYEDGDVFFFSTHQSPWYPGTGARGETGEGAGAGATLNAPLPAGSGIDEIGAAFREEFAPRMEGFRPELVLVSAGFDSREGDPLGQFRLRDEDFVALTELLLGIASEHSGGRLVSLLEGGYHLGGLASAATRHLEALMGEGA